MSYVPQLPVGTPSRRGYDAEPLRIFVFGGTGVGKSTFVNDASRAGLGVGHDLTSHTKDVQTSPVFQVDNRNVQLYDTPGFDDTNMTDTDILKVLARTLEGMHRAGQKITGLVYFHRITDNRFSGASVRAFELFVKMCGLDNMRNVLIVTNMWSLTPDPEEETRERQLRSEFFRDAVENGARMARRAGPGPESARAIIRQLLRSSPVVLQLQAELALGLPLNETQAGMLVEENLRVRLERQRREKEELEEELQAAREDRDRKAQEQLERYKRDREEEEERLKQMIAELQAARQSVQMQAANLPAHGDRATQGRGAMPQERGNERAHGTRWTPRFLAGRSSGVRGQEPTVPARSASLGNTRSAAAENRAQGRTRVGTPVGRKGVFAFRSRVKMAYWRRRRTTASVEST
ncbi:50S ribosome-binding GTPase [Ceratobasidium sp. AG-Ba]|nr:50S ribosome-binding GTPase [Ceratobasidium sp. AG-Ba]